MSTFHYLYLKQKLSRKRPLYGGHFEKGGGRGRGIGIERGEVEEEEEREKERRYWNQNLRHKSKCLIVSYLTMLNLICTALRAKSVCDMV